MNATFKKQQGYVALVTALLVSAVLMVLVFTIGLSPFMNRNGIASSQWKQKSFTLAEGCVRVALVKLVQNAAYAGGETLSVASDTCQIVSVTASSSQKVISTSAQFNDAETSLKVIFDPVTGALSGWEELSHF